MLSTSRRQFLWALPALASSPLSAQFKRVEGSTPPAPNAPSPDADANFRIDVDVVNLLATVRSSGGSVVANLNKEDFTLLDNGEPREIQYFSRQSDLPLTIGILFDTSLSQRNVIEEQRRAAAQFLDEVVRPGQDQAFIIKFDSEVVLVQDLTSSKELLHRALSGLQVRELPARRFQATPEESRFQVSVGVPIPGGRRRRGGVGVGTGRRQPPVGGRPSPGGAPGGRASGMGTSLYDAVYLAADEILAPQPGRKAILLLTDGVDHGSKLGAEECVEATLRADSIVYSILYADGQMHGGRGALAERGKQGIEVLRNLSLQTGGAFHEVADDLPLATVFAQLQEELRNQYSVGFTPAPASGSNPDFRPIDLRVSDTTLQVRTRKGYYPKVAG